MHFIQFRNLSRQDITTALQQQAQILSPNLNLLLKYAIKEKNKELFDIIVDAVVENHKNIINIIEKFEMNKEELFIDNFGQVYHKYKQSVYPFFVYTIPCEIENEIPSNWVKLNAFNESLRDLEQLGIDLRKSRWNSVSLKQKMKNVYNML